MIIHSQFILSNNAIIQFLLWLNLWNLFPMCFSLWPILSTFSMYMVHLEVQKMCLHSLLCQYTLLISHLSQMLIFGVKISFYNLSFYSEESVWFFTLLGFNYHLSVVLHFESFHCSHPFQCDDQALSEFHVKSPIRLYTPIREVWLQVFKRYIYFIILLILFYYISLLYWYIFHYFPQLKFLYSLRFSFLNFCCII